MQPGDDALFQTGDIGLGDSKPVRHLFLRLLPAASQSKAQRDDLLFPGREHLQCRGQQRAVHILLNGTHDRVLLCPQHIAEQQLVSVPIGVERLIKGDLPLSVGIFAQMHQDLIFDTAGGIRRQLDVLVRPVGAHRLDEPDGADGNQVLDPHSRVFEPPGNVHHKPQIMFDELLPGRLLLQPGQQLRLPFLRQRRRQRVAAADVMNALRRQQSQTFQQPARPAQ